MPAAASSTGACPVRRSSRQLLSAHWFATRADADPFVDRHVRHAVQIAGALDVARLFPLRVPGHAVAAGAVALLIAVAAHAWPRMRDATACASEGPPVSYTHLTLPTSDLV